MKKILQVTCSFVYGGTESFIMNHYRHIDHTRFQYDFLVICANSSPYEEEIRALGGRVIYSQANPSIAHPQRFIREIKDIIIQNGPYNAVHSHINLSNSFVLYAAKLAGIKHRISHSHNTGCLGSNPLMKPIRLLQRQLLFHSATSLLACGEAAGRDLYGNRKFTVIHNGIDVDRFLDPYFTPDFQSDFEPKEIHQKLPSKSEVLERILGQDFLTDYSLDPDTKIYANISRFDQQKNLPFVIDIFSEIIKRQPNSFLIVGGQDGPLKQTVIDKVNQYNIHDNVRILGARQDIPQLLQLLDAYIFPSHFEGLPFALLETQAAGLHAFVSDVITSEIDLGLGLIHPISLSLPASEWAQQILNTDISTTPSKEQINTTLSSSGYNISDSVQQLQKIYNQ